jgi:hypothetical protein
MTSQPPFIPVGALAEGFAPESNILPNVGDLNGRTLRIEFSDGGSETLSFTSTGMVKTENGERPCRVTSLRSGLYFVDFVDGANDGRPTTRSIVVDDKQGLVTSVVSQLPNEQDARVDAITRVERRLPLMSVSAEIRHGRTPIEGVEPVAPLHRPTQELIGKRVLYDYSATEQYEHIYLNDNLYTWHCLTGVEAGLADSDQCYYIAIAENLYLFVWCEKIIPTVGIVLIDLDKRKTDGKIVGYKGNDFDSLSNFPVGAHARVLNDTQYS